MWLLWAEPEAVAYERPWANEYREPPAISLTATRTRCWLLGPHRRQDDGDGMGEGARRRFGTVQPKVLQAMMRLVENGAWKTVDPTLRKGNIVSPKRTIST